MKRYISCVTRFNKHCFLRSCILWLTLIILLTAFSAYCEYSTTNDLLIISAYIADNDTSFFRQALLLFDIEQRTTIDTLCVPDGSLMVDGTDGIYIVERPGYGALQTLMRYCRTGYEADITITRVDINEGHFTQDLECRTAVSNNAFVFSVSADTDYIMEVTNDREFTVAIRINHFLGNSSTVLDIGDFFDMFHSWIWPSEVICVNKDGVTALVSYSSWLTESSLAIADFNQGTFNYVLCDYVYGPLCWINDNEIMLFKKSLKNNVYYAITYNIRNEQIALYDCCLDGYYPVIDMSYSNGQCVFWSENNDKLELVLMAEGAEPETLLQFDSLSDTQTMTFQALIDEKVVRIPIQIYQPTIALR